MSEKQLLAIDPGNTDSAFVVYDGTSPVMFGKWKNETLLREMQVGASFPLWRCAIEMIGHYGSGMSVGREVFDTCIWIGRFSQVWHDRQGGDKFGLSRTEYILRATVKAHVCGSAKAKDSNIRQALIDRWGGDSIAIGGKKCKRCKGRGFLGNRRMPCGTFACDCNGGYETPPGPLKGISADVWQALAVAVTWWDTQSQAKDVA